MRTDQPARRSSAASTKSCDMIAPPNGFLPGQRRQAGGGRERAHANDRVVPPIVAVVALPGGDAAADDRAVDSRRELLEPREQRLAAREPRHGLQKPKLRVRRHLADQREQRVGRQ